MDEYKHPPIASGLAETSVAAQTGVHEQVPNESTGNGLNRKTCLICLVISILIAIVNVLTIHVSKIRQSNFSSEKKYNELKSTLQSKLSALNSNLTNLKRIHRDLRHQFTEMETKYRSVNETKAQICELLTIRRDQLSFQDWIRNEDGCYFISTSNVPYDEARQYCPNSDSKLLEINSAEEENFIGKAVRDQHSAYWIGKCKDGKVASKVYYRNVGRKVECDVCTWYTERKYCDQIRTRSICEKSAHLCPDISEKIQYLCQ